MTLIIWSLCTIAFQNIPGFKSFNNTFLILTWIIRKAGKTNFCSYFSNMSIFPFNYGNIQPWNNCRFFSNRRITTFFFLYISIIRRPFYLNPNIPFYVCSFGLIEGLSGFYHSLKWAILRYPNPIFQPVNYFRKIKKIF